MVTPFFESDSIQQLITTHQWAHNAFILAIDVDDLKSGKLCQIQATCEGLKESPNLDGPKCWSVLQKSSYGNPLNTHINGCTLPTRKSVLVVLDTANVPCDAVQSFTWNLFNKENLLIFEGPKAKLVRFWAPSGSSTPETHASSLAPINTQVWKTPPKATSFEMRVPSNKKQLPAHVIAGLFGPYDNYSPSYDGNVFIGEFRHTDSVALAHNFVMGGSSIIHLHPNDLRIKAILDSFETSSKDDPEQQRIVLAGMALGGTEWVRELIENKELLNNLSPPPPKSTRLVTTR